MKIENRNGEANVSFVVDDIEGDMGEVARLRLLVQADGDVVLTLYNTKKKFIDSLEFCSSSGGGRYPIIAKKLRELVAELVNLNRLAPIKEE